MSAMWAWVRIDLRSRVRSLLVLALLVAVTTGVVLTATAGARRGASVVDRLLDATEPATVAALPNEPGFDWDAVAELPNVEAVGQFPVASPVVDGVEQVDFAYGAGVMDEVERPVVLEGRLADPRREDEAVITEAFESTHGKGVGDTVTMRLLSPEQADDPFSDEPIGAPAGPVIEARIVGVVRSPWFSDSGDSTDGRIIPSPAVFERYRENLIGTGEIVYVNALIRLRGGGASVAAFREDLAELTGRDDIDFFDLAGEATHLEEVTSFEASTLFAFALAALVAATFLVGQSIVRFVAGTTQDLQVLGAVGMRPRHVRIGAAIGPTLAATVGALVGAAGSVAVSDGFPMGSAGPFEPNPGRSIDAVVIVGGVLLIPALVAAGAMLASVRAARATAIGAPVRPSPVAGLAARLGVPVPVSVGARFALEPGRGAQAVPVLPALVGAVVGVIGVVGALTIADGVDDATSHPQRFGQVSDLQAFVGIGGQDFAPVDELVPALAGHPDVAGVNDARQSVTTSGEHEVAVYTLDPKGGVPPVVLTKGRLPAPEELLLAATTAGLLDVDVGDRIPLTGSSGSGTFTVSGFAFVPEGPHNEYDTGAWVLPETYDELVEGFKFRTIDVTLRDGVSTDAAAERLGVLVGEVLGDPAAGEGAFDLVSPPARLGELRQIERLPLYLAAFLALLAVAAVGHAVATAVRRRRHDLAVLRAVGVTRLQSRITVVTQATVLAVVGVVVGTPLGLVVGRLVWGRIADTTPLQHVPPSAVLALVLVAPVALVVANLLAAWPSHRAATMRVGHVLRTE